MEYIYTAAVAQTKYNYMVFLCIVYVICFTLMSENQDWKIWFNGSHVSTSIW